MFWEWWLTTDDPDIAWQRQDCLKALDRPLIPALAASAGVDEAVRVLDVGAGPLTRLGVRIDERVAEITPIDPLARQYAPLLERLAIEAPIPTLPGEGETLVERFGESAFHGVYCANALDHCYAPLRVLRQMVSVVRPGGAVGILCYNNGAEREEYNDLHKWNLTIRDGRPVLWNRTEEIDIASYLAESATVEGQINDVGLVDVWITKESSGP